MPYYDYECQKCRTTLEVKASIAEKEAGLSLKCPDCGSNAMEQVFLSVAVATSSGHEVACASAPGGVCQPKRHQHGTGCGCGVH